MRRLIIRPGAVGDTIVSLPALEALCSDVDAEIWAPERNLDLLRHLAPCCSLVACGLDALELSAATLQRLRAFGEIYSWYGTARPDFREQVRDLPFRFLPALPPAAAGCHAVDFYLDQLGLPRGGVPRLPVRRRDEGFVVIHPFSGGAKKNWPLEHFRAVAARLPMPVHWCAGPDEPLAGAMRFNTLSALIEWLAGARVYLGNDSGISHLAAACGIPVVAVFGPTDPAVWAPRGECVRIAEWAWSPERLTAEVLRCCSWR